MRQQVLKTVETRYTPLKNAGQATEQSLLPKRGSPSGIPATKSRFSGKDGALVATIFFCFGVAVISVFSQRAAVYLGQTNQLVIIGICLSTMALVCQRQVLFAFILRTVSSGSASLQDVEAVLGNSVFIARSSYMCKCVLLLLAVLPLGLGAAYKRFVGGVSTITVTSQAGQFGFSSPPGFQRIGLGLTMIPQVYLPFWLDPVIGASYSFNLLVQSNDTSALLDIPLPEYVDLLRRDLRPNEAVILTATVNATVSENVPLSPSLQHNDTFWSNFTQTYTLVNLFDGYYAFFANDNMNHSFAYVSIFNDTAGQTLGSQMQQNHITRRACRGTWRITPSNITLLDGEVLETTDEARANRDQSIIENSNMQITDLFGRFVVEYDWNRYPRVRPVNTVPSLTATMIWSRLVAECGAGEYWSTSIWSWASSYSKPPADLTTRLERATLKRSSLLLVVLTVLPVLSVMATVVKVLLYKCPVDDTFGLTSILAAIDPGTLEVTRGAGLSGRMSRRVGIHFGVKRSPQPMTEQRIEIQLDETGPLGYVHRKTLYR